MVQYQTTIQHRSTRRQRYFGTLASRRATILAAASWTTSGWLDMRQLYAVLSAACVGPYRSVSLG
eukprot:1980285-Rhodomonas_salina.2